MRGQLTVWRPPGGSLAQRGRVGLPCPRPAPSGAGPGDDRSRRGPGPAPPSRNTPCSAGPEPAALPEVGQSGGHDKSELGTAARRPLHGDRPAVRLDQPFDDEQAEPGAAAALGAPELAEDPRHELWGDTVTRVTDR